MTPTAYYSPVGEGDVPRVRKLVAALGAKHPELRDGGDFLWSACGYLLADGQPLNDSRVLAEARKRKARFDELMAQNARKRKRWAAEREAAA